MSAAALPKLRRNRIARDPRVAPGQRGQDAPRAVAAAVVDEDELDRPPRAVGEHGVELAVERGQALLLVMDGDDDADHG